MAGQQTYINPADAHRIPFVGAPSSTGAGFDYGASARHMTRRNNMLASIPGAGFDYDPVTGSPTRQAAPNGAAAQPKSWLDKLYDEYTTAHKDAKADTDKYFGVASNLYGYDADGRPLNPNVAYDPSVVALSGMRGGEWSPGNLGPALTPPTWEGSSAAGRSVDAEMMKRGVYNSGSAVLNKFKADQGAKFDADMSTYGANMNLFNTQRQIQTDAMDRLERNRNDAAQHFSSREYQYPDPAILAQLAMQTGQGTTEGIIGGGGYGGSPFMAAGDMGYVTPGVGTGGGVRSGGRKPPMQGPPMPRSTKKLTPDQQAMARKSASSMASRQRPFGGINSVSPSSIPRPSLAASSYSAPSASMPRIGAPNMPIPSPYRAPPMTSMTPAYNNPFYEHLMPYPTIGDGQYYGGGSAPSFH